MVLGDNMKKLTIFSLHLGYGGIEQAVVNLANLLCEDYEVEIVSTYKLYDEAVFEIDKRVKVNYLIDDHKPNREEFKQAIRKFNLVKVIKESYKALVTLFLKRRCTIDAMKKCDSDIMISTRLLFNKWLGSYGNKKSYRIAWEHNHHHQDIEYANKLVGSCRNLDSLVLVSDSLRSFYKRKMKYKNIKCKCVFIPNMLDYIPDKCSELTEKRIISVGRLSKEKGFVDLIEVFNRIHQKYPDWTLDLVGDGSERNKVVDRIYQYNLAEFVTVHGYLKKDKINELLSKSSVYLMTSYTESFGVVLIEAMSHGIPCLAFTSAEGANDLINDGNSGYLIKNRDIDEMVSKVGDLIDSKEKRLEFGKKSRDISLKYGCERVKDDWIKLLKKKV